MGFFDFLTAPKQDTSDLQREQADLRKKNRNQQIPDAEPFQDDEAARLKEFQGPHKGGPAGAALKVEPVQSTFADNQERLASEIAELAAEIEVDAQSKALQDVPTRDRFGAAPPNKAAFMGRYIASPEDAAQTLEKRYNPKLLQGNPKVQELYRKILEYKRAGRTDEGLAHTASLSGPVDEASLDKVRGELKEIQEQKNEIQEMLPDAASDAHRNELQRQLKDLTSAEQAKVSRLSSLEQTMNRQRFPRSGPPVPQSEVYGEQPGEQDWQNRIVTSLDDPGRGFSSAGVSRSETAQAVNEGVDAVAKSMGPDFNPNDRVSFQYALPYAIQAMGPEAQAAFSTWARDIRSKEAFVYTGNPGQDASDMSGETSVKPTDHNRLIQQNMEVQKAARADLANAQELQSWPSIIAFVILGMLIGPQGAFAFFSNARRKNQLRGWLQQLEMERRYLIDEQKYKRETEAELRLEAARRLQKTEDRAADIQHQIGMKLLDHKLMIERMEKRADPNSALAKKLASSFSRASTMASQASKTANNPFASPEKQREAQSDFDYWIRKMVELDGDLSELGGEVLAEEVEE